MYNDWSTVLHLVDIVSCCALLLPIVWQVNSLEESVEVGTESEQDEESDLTRAAAAAGKEQGSSVGDGDGVPVEENAATSSRLQSKLYLVRSFYLIVVGYIYFTRVVIYLFASSLKYDQTWIRTFVYELGTLTFYFVVGMKFKPVDESYAMDYSKVSQSTVYDPNGGNDDDGGNDISASLPRRIQKLEQKQIELSNLLGGGKVAKD